MKEKIQLQPVLTSQAPAPIGPYSQAMSCGGMLYCSGQIALDPVSGELRGDVTSQTHQVMKNISSVLKAAGIGLDRIVKTTIFLKSMADFPAVNEIYGSYLAKPYPARSTVEVSALPKGALVEIEVLAAL